MSKFDMKPPSNRRVPKLLIASQKVLLVSVRFHKFPIFPSSETKTAAADTDSLQ